MGIDYNVYVGPYIIADIFPQEVTKQKKSCPNEECKKYKQWASNGFCSSCGSKVQLVSYPEMDNVPLNWKLTEERTDQEADEFNNYLNCMNACEDDSFDCYIPNQRLKGVPDRKTYVDPRYESVFQELDADVIEKEKEALKATFEKQIAMLESWHGKENVHIKWGFLSWTS